jgi:deoxyribose-phosphate aldolase
VVVAGQEAPLVPARDSAAAPSSVRAPAVMSLAEALQLSISIDAVAVEARAQQHAKRSLKRESKVWGLKLAMSTIDVSTLEGMDSPGRVTARCRKAIRPDPSDPSIPSCAAVCVYPVNVALAKRLVAGSSVKVASVATGFPAGQMPLALHAGDDAYVYDEVAAVKEVCGSVLLKVIVETGELGSYDQIRRASMLSMAAGADYIKTSTGKVPGRATLGNTQVMLEAIRDFGERTGRMVGMKPAGNLNTAKLALAYMVQLYETLGPAWMTPTWYRIGASSLMNDILMQLRKEKTGAYQSPDSFSID